MRHNPYGYMTQAKTFEMVNILNSVTEAWGVPVAARGTFA